MSLDVKGKVTGGGTEATRFDYVIAAVVEIDTGAITPIMVETGMGAVTPIVVDTLSFNVVVDA